MNKCHIPIIPENAKVLLQLSGGKDSMACMILLRDNNIEFEAIHFKHKYGYSLPTTMAKKACECFEVKLNVVDISSEIDNVFLNGFNKRPCRYCKGIMDKITTTFAVNNGYSLICIGDTKDDKTLMNRMLANEGSINHISRYFNFSVSLPDEVSIYRPLLEYDGEDTLSLVVSRFPWFKRVNDTGDKYFEYSREGCPLQFKDYGAQYTKDMMRELKHLNTLCGEYAAKKGIRASIHLPSEFIVTIPRGYEDECRQYLLTHGAKLRPVLRDSEAYNANHILIDISLNSSMCDTDIINVACDRLIERLGICGDLLFCGKIGHLSNDSVTFDVIQIRNDRLLISITSNESRWQKPFVENVCLEIFHTWRFRVLDYQV